MKTFSPALLIAFLLAAFIQKAQMVVIYGTVKNASTGEPVPGAQVRLSNSLISAVTDRNGFYRLQLIKRNTYQLLVRQLAFESLTKMLRDSGTDSTICDFSFKQKFNLLDSVTVTAIHRPETLVGKPSYSVYDFEFSDDNFLLLTAEKSLQKAVVRLADNSGNILLNWQVPASAGEAQRFYRDFEGYTELICKDSIFRIELLNNDFMISAVPRRVYSNYLEPISDSLGKRLYWTNRSDMYPAMDYFYLNKGDSVSDFLRQVSNDDLLKLYNLEYYYLPSRARLEADRIASLYKTDKHIVAAAMSGFTSSLYYEPLYAPLFVMNDTICIFNHYNDRLFHYDRNSKLIDSVSISYHHPKNWREWKKKLFVDESSSRIYAYFSKDGHHYLKLIDHQNGLEKSTYRLKNHSAANIRVKAGYVYYIYRPFQSTQQKFLYRERIE